MQSWCKCLHAITQCVVVLGFSLNDMRLYPNTLLIRSLPGVNFWVFYPRDLSPFLIHLTWTFTFHHYSFFSFFCHFMQFLSFLNTTMMQMNVTRLITIIYKYHINFQLVQTSLELQSYHKFQNFPTISIIPIFKYKYFLHTKITKSNQ